MLRETLDELGTDLPKLLLDVAFRGGFILRGRRPITLGRQEGSIGDVLQDVLWSLLPVERSQRAWTASPRVRPSRRGWLTRRLTPRAISSRAILERACLSLRRDHGQVFVKACP